MTLLVVFDTETTGRRHKTAAYRGADKRKNQEGSLDSVIQLGSVMHRIGEERCAIFNQLADPGKPIPASATEVHGITDAMVAGYQSPGQMIVEWWSDAISLAEPGEEIILAGHNIDGFDIPFVARHVDVTQVRTIDTLKLARRFETCALKHTLEFLYCDHRMLNSDRTLTAHDALSDVWMSFELLRVWMLEREYETYEAVTKYLELPVYLHAMPFGEHKRKSFQDIPRHYLAWLAGNAGMDADVVYSAKCTLQGVG